MATYFSQKTSFRIMNTLSEGAISRLEGRGVPGDLLRPQLAVPEVVGPRTYGFPSRGPATLPKDRWSRTIDLGVGEYTRMSPQWARLTPGDYRYFKTVLDRFNNVGTSIATVGFGLSELAIQAIVGAWSAPAGSARHLTITNVTGNPATGWQKSNGGCMTEDRWWGIFNQPACGTAQTGFTSDKENRTVNVSVYRAFETTPALPVNPQLWNGVFNNVAQYRTNVGNSSAVAPNPFRLALVAPGVSSVPWDANLPTGRFMMSHPVRPRLSLRPPYAVPVTQIEAGPSGPVKVSTGVALEVPPPDGVPQRRKYKLGKGGWIGTAYGALTELNDLMDCMHSSINRYPKGVKGRQTIRGNTRVAPDARGANPYDRFRYIVNNAERMDPVAFVKCFAKKELGDQVIGRLNNRAASALGQSGYWPFARGPGLSRFATHGTQFPGSLRMR